jgi:uncharacterized protein YbjQ (UPF0145 family)
MLMTTTDTLPQPFTALGLVDAEIGEGLFTSERSTGKRLAEAEHQMEEQARELGGDAVIGIRVSALVGTLMVIGTAVKLN